MAGLMDRLYYRCASGSHAGKLNAGVYTSSLHQAFYCQNGYIPGNGFILKIGWCWNGSTKLPDLVTTSFFKNMLFQWQRKKSICFQ